MRTLEPNTPRVKPASSPVAPQTEVAPAPSDLLGRLLEPGVCDVRDRLLAHGASPELTTRIVHAVLERGAKGAWAIDAAADGLGRSFTVMPSPRVRRGSSALRSLVFVGPSGGGKTSTLAKLARRLGEVGRRVVNASLDATGAAALEGIGARPWGRRGGRIGGREVDQDRTEVPLLAIRDVTDLRRGLDAQGQVDLCLIDTPGLSPRDRGPIEELARELERLANLGPVDVLLVMPANLSRSAARLACDAAAPLWPTGCVLTKLDETDQPLAALEVMQAAGLPLAFLCDGADVRGHLARPSAARLADLALRGRYR